MDALRSGIRSYPRDWGFHNELSGDYMDIGQFEDSLVEAQEAVRLQPNVEPPYRWALNAHMKLDRLNEANEVAKKARAQGLDGARLHWRFLEIAFVGGDRAAADKEIQWYAGKPEEYFSFGSQALNADAMGQRSAAAKLYRRAAETALRRNLLGAAAALRNPTRLLPRYPGIARQRTVWGVRRWLQRCVVIQPKPRSSPRRLRRVFQVAPSGMRSNCPRFAPRSSYTAINRARRWNCWHPPHRTSAHIPRRFTCAAWPTCACIRARRPRPSFRKSWIIRAPTGDCFIRSRTSVWPARRRLQRTRAKPEKLSRIFWRYGKMPIRIHLFWSKRAKSPLRCGKRTTSPSFMIALSRYHGTL